MTTGLENKHSYRHKWKRNEDIEMKNIHDRVY